MSDSPRDEARRRGEKRFSLGAPCKHGHVAERWTSTGACCECNRLAFLAYRAANLERERERRKEYYAKHRSQEREKYRANRDAILRDRKAYKTRTADKRRETYKKWVEANIEKVRSYTRNRRALQRGAPGTHSADDVANIRKMQRDRCAMPECRKKLHGRGHVDHIEPLSKGGSNDRRNLQLLCGPCNVQKHTKRPTDIARDNWRLL